MKPNSRNVKITYYLLTLLSTLAASFIWGINTLFLLDAGLSNAQAFAANAFFTVGQVLFEIPTGVIADTRGRKTSYALGALTLLITTLAYYWLWQTHGPFWGWALVSALLGLGFTFFSGATEAWLVDALKFTKYESSLETVFSKGQAIGGAAMLIGSVSGGYIAQNTNLGVPYIIRATILGVTLIACLIMMKDWGFDPHERATPLKQVKKVLSSAVENGWRKPAVKWMMIANPFVAGVGFYVFYALQPYLLELYGKPNAYGVAGLAAAIIASAQIVGGLSSEYAKKFFTTRTNVMIGATVASTIAIGLLAIMPNFWAAIGLMVLWGLTTSLADPIRRAYLNGLIDSKQRATVLSFDSLMGSSGGAIVQPILGKVADGYGYASSYLVSAIFQAGSIPFLFLAKKQKAESDSIDK